MSKKTERAAIDTAGKALRTIRAQIKSLEESEQKIVSTFREEGPGIYSGDELAVIVECCKRARLSADLVNEVFGAGSADRCKKPEEFLQVKVVNQ